MIGKYRISHPTSPKPVNNLDGVSKYQNRGRYGAVNACIKMRGQYANCIMYINECIVQA